MFKLIVVNDTAKAIMIVLNIKYLQKIKLHRIHIIKQKYMIA